MTDFYLRLPDEATFEILKGMYPFAYDEGGNAVSPGWTIDEIGIVYKATSWDKEGNATLEPTEGYLVNMRSDNELPESLTEYVVFPVTPVRVWA